MLHKKIVFWILCLSSLCFQGVGFSEDSPQHLNAQYHHNERLAKKQTPQPVYYLYVQDFIDSMIMTPTSNVNDDSSTISSRYLAGLAPIYKGGDEKFGICSASFLCMQNEEGIFSDISNYLTIDNGLIVSWFTPSTLANLELDSIVHGMVTECIVLASTKVGFNPYYGQQFNMVVSADDEKIYFILTPIL